MERPRQICIVVGSPRQGEKHEILVACRSDPPLRCEISAPVGYAVSLTADEQDSKRVPAVCARLMKVFQIVLKNCRSDIPRGPVSRLDSSRAAFRTSVSPHEVPYGWHCCQCFDSAALRSTRTGSGRFASSFQWRGHRISVHAAPSASVPGSISKLHSHRQPAL
jgi:hypothetical protein